MNLFSDWFVYFLNCYIYKKNGSKNLIKQKRNYILLKSSDGAIHLSQRISILRLFRANSFNILLFFLTTFINPDSFLIKSIKDIKTFQIILILLFIFLILGYVKNFCGYCSFINTSYKIIKGEKK